LRAQQPWPRPSPSDPRRHDGSLRAGAAHCGRRPLRATLSLAGRTSTPRAQPLATRIGGFGGVDGLARFLGDHAVDAVIDATHPYADQISTNALGACERTGVPLVSIARPAWQAEAGDCWHAVRDADAAAAALARRRVACF